MQPLYEIGLAVRKRKVEIDARDEGKPFDWNLVQKGNHAAHHGQALADSTWMDEKLFKKIYNGVPPSVVWQRREFTQFQQVLNWWANMRLWGRFNGISSAEFFSEFFVVWKRIYPLLKICEEFEGEGEIALAFKAMREAESNARELHRRISNSIR